MKKDMFFRVAPVASALALVREHLPQFDSVETVSTFDAVGRVLAKSPQSPLDLPEYNRSAMDGFAVRAQDTFGATSDLPAYLRQIANIEMGSAPDFQIEAGQTASIHTGGMLPDGADAVVMIERTQVIANDEIEVQKAVAPGENVVHTGEDVQVGQPLLSKGHRLRPQDIGALLALGITQVICFRRVRIGIMGSGDEIVPPTQQTAYGQIRDINSFALAALFQQHGAKVEVLGIAADDYDAIAELAEAGHTHNDILVITAGSSVSTRDYTRDAIDALGSPGVLQHGLAVKPGKPAILAVCDGKAVIGLPGNPVSAYLVARQVVLPVLRMLYNEPEPTPFSIEATLTSNIASASGREDTVPVRLHPTDDGWEAEPLFGKSNLIFTLVNADGILRIPLDDTGINSGSRVWVEKI